MPAKIALNCLLAVKNGHLGVLKLLSIIVVTCTLSSCQKEKVVVVEEEESKEVKAEFSFEVKGTTVAFTNESANWDRCEWNFGKRSLSNSDQENPEVEYKALGTYKVKLIVWYLHWSDTVEHDVTIETFNIKQIPINVNAPDWYKVGFRIYDLPGNDKVSSIEFQLATDKQFETFENAYILEKSKLKLIKGKLSLPNNYDFRDIHLDVYNLKPNATYAVRFKLEIGNGPIGSRETIYSEAKLFTTTEFILPELTLVNLIPIEGHFDYETSLTPSKGPSDLNFSSEIKYSTTSDFQNEVELVDFLSGTGRYLLNLGASLFIEYTVVHKNYPEISYSDVKEVECPYTYVSRTNGVFGTNIQAQKILGGTRYFFEAENGDKIELNLVNKKSAGSVYDYAIESELPIDNKNYIIYHRADKNDTLYCDPTKDYQLKKSQYGTSVFYKLQWLGSGTGIGFRKYGKEGVISRLTEFHFKAE